MLNSFSDKKMAKASNLDDEMAIGENLSFAASEAYKRLRTSLIFSLPKDANKTCRIIGITSPREKEGKSTTAINLAYSLAESGQLVLCIEGDMRLPHISKRLKLQPSPGLSECLVGEVTNGYEALRKINENLYVMPSGSVPPNPSELLASPEMHHMIDLLTQNFSYIIIDLPPVGAVADPLIVSEIVDGMIMVVRKNYATKRTLASAMRELNLVNAKVLGFVFNDVTESGKKYKKYKYYGGYGYGSSYASSHSKAKSKSKNADQSDGAQVKFDDN